MKRPRITVQIEECDRQKIDKLVYDHKARSISDIVRVALQEFLSKEKRIVKKEATSKIRQLCSKRKQNLLAKTQKTGEKPCPTASI